MRISKQALFFGLCAFSLAPSALNGGEALQMKVSPAIQRAPAMLTVRVTVESSEDNRLLQVIAESPTFYRSSEVEIDGANASPTADGPLRGYRRPGRHAGPARDDLPSRRGRGHARRALTLSSPRRYRRCCVSVTQSTDDETCLRRRDYFFLQFARFEVPRLNW